MSDIKSRVKGMDPNVQALDMAELNKKTKNVYETISIIRDRAKRLNKSIKTIHERVRRVRGICAWLCWLCYG